MDSLKMVTTLFVSLKLMVYRKVMIFESASVVAYIFAATSEFEERKKHPVKRIRTGKFKHHKFSVHYQL